MLYVVIPKEMPSPPPEVTPRSQAYYEWQLDWQRGFGERIRERFPQVLIAAVQVHSLFAEILDADAAAVAEEIHRAFGCTVVRNASNAIVTSHP